MTKCLICGVYETDNPDGICDNCKASMLQDDGVNLGFGEEFD